MPAYRAYFATAAEAEAGAIAAIERLNARLLAETTEAGATPPTTAPTTSTSVEATTALPVGALPTGAEDHVLVDWRITSSAGHVERHRSIMRADQAPQPIPASAVVTIATTTRAKLRVKATLPAEALITTTGAHVAGTLVGKQLEDRATGKKFTVSADGSVSTTTAGTYPITIAEASAAEDGEVTHGTQLVFTRPPTNVLPHAYVSVMKSAAIPIGTALTDAATGKTYETTTLGDLPGTTESLSGDDVDEIEFVGAEPGDAAVAVGTELTFDTPISGVASTAEVTESPTATLPAGSTLARAGKSYTTSADATIGDAGEAEVSIVADAADAASALSVSDTLTITSPPSGIDATATVSVASPFLPFPQPFASQVLGPAVEWRSRVRRTNDGLYRAEVYTYPPGT